MDFTFLTMPVFLAALLAKPVQFLQRIVLTVLNTESSQAQTTLLTKHANVIFLPDMLKLIMVALIPPAVILIPSVKPACSI